MRCARRTLKGGGLFAPISREGALVLNNLLLACGCADGVPRHALSAVPGRDRRAEAVGRLPVLQPHLRAADGAAAAGGRRRAACWPGSAATCWARCSGCGRPSRLALVVALGGLLRDAGRRRCWRCSGSRWPPGCSPAPRSSGPSGCACSAPRSPRAGAARSTCRARRYGMTFAHMGLAITRRRHLGLGVRGREHPARAGRRRACRSPATCCTLPAVEQVPGPELQRRRGHDRDHPRRRADRDDASRAAVLPAAAADHQR